MHPSSNTDSFVEVLTHDYNPTMAAHVHPESQPETPAQPETPTEAPGSSIPLAELVIEPNSDRKLICAENSLQHYPRRRHSARYDPSTSVPAAKFNSCDLPNPELLSATDDRAFKEFVRELFDGTGIHASSMLARLVHGGLVVLILVGATPGNCALRGLNRCRWSPSVWRSNPSAPLARVLQN